MRISAIDLDDARAADAGDAGGAARGESRVVGPELGADDAEARLLGRGVDLDALDGAGRGALAGGDLRALEGGAGGRGAGEHPARGCRAGSRRWCRRRRPASARRTGSAPRTAPPRRRPRPHGRRCRAGCRCARRGAGGRSISVGPERQRVGGGEREGRLAELHRVDAEQQVVHHRVADDHRLEDQSGVDAAPRRRPAPTSAFSASRTARVISAAPPGFIIA